MNGINRRFLGGFFSKSSTHSYFSPVAVNKQLEGLWGASAAVPSCLYVYRHYRDGSSVCLGGWEVCSDCLPLSVHCSQTVTFREQ